MNDLTTAMQSKDFKYHGLRNSNTELNEVHFWTITINKWQHLFPLRVWPTKSSQAMSLRNYIALQIAYTAGLAAGSVKYLNRNNWKFQKKKIINGSHIKFLILFQVCGESFCICFYCLLAHWRERLGNEEEDQEEPKGL